jgi:hypothetical protein
MTVCAHERAAAAVALPHLADRAPWGSAGHARLRAIVPAHVISGTSQSRLTPRTLLLEMRDVVLHGTRVDQRRVARRHRVAEQRLSLAQVVVLVLRDRQSHFVAAGVRR